MPETITFIYEDDKLTGGKQIVMPIDVTGKHIRSLATKEFNLFIEAALAARAFTPPSQRPNGSL